MSLAGNSFYVLAGRNKAWKVQPPPSATTSCHSWRVCRSRCRGFTLIELLVVMAMITLIGAIVTPTIGSGLSTLRLRTSGREIAAALRMVRSKAIKEQQIYYVGFNGEKEEVEWGSADSSFQKTFSLPDGISFREVDGQQLEGEPVYYYFLPNGRGERFSVKIGSDRGRELVVSQDVLTGTPRIEEIQPDVAGSE